VESDPPRDNSAELIVLMRGRWGTISAPDLNSSNDSPPMPSYNSRPKGGTKGVSAAAA
jgi:hypothetical protein